MAIATVIGADGLELPAAVLLAKAVQQHRSLGARCVSEFRAAQILVQGYTLCSALHVVPGGI